jgi:hypothetical protein
LSTTRSKRLAFQALTVEPAPKRLSVEVRVLALSLKTIKTSKYLGVLLTHNKMVLLWCNALSPLCYLAR